MQHSSWHALIKEQLPEGYFGKINQFMEQVYSHGTIYPPKEKVFQALLTTPLEEVKVVDSRTRSLITGQVKRRALSFFCYPTLSQLRHPCKYLERIVR